MDEKDIPIQPETTPTQPVGVVKTYVAGAAEAIESNNPIRTYTADITKAIEGNRGEVVKKMIEEQDEYKNSQKAQPTETPKGRIYILFTILFFVLTISALVIFFQNKENINTVEVAPQYKSLVFTDHAEPVELKDFNKDDIAKNIFNLIKNTKVKIGGVEGVYPTLNAKIIGLKTFMSLIGGNLMVDKTPAIHDNFLLGAVHYMNVGITNTKSTSADEATVPVPAVAPAIIEGKLISLNSSVFFKTGTVAFIDSTAKDKAKKAIIDFLDGIDFTATKISVIGTYSKERPSKQNDALAEQRRKLGISILNEVLTAKYSADDIKKITIDSSAKGVSIHDIYTQNEITAMTKAELESALSSTQGIQYFAQAKAKSVIASTSVSGDTTTQTSTETNKSKILTSENVDFFMLLSIRSFADVFKAMRDWEPFMFQDLHGFIGVDITPSNQYLLTKSFEDGVIQNRNARVLYDSNGKVVLMYAYTDDTSIVITSNENVAREIMLRLAASQIKK